MKGKWATGIPPRNFAWVIPDRLAISERPGGFAPNHRRVRRHEEIVWLQHQGITRVISLLTSTHNLGAYAEEGIDAGHHPLPTMGDPRPALAACFADLESSLEQGCPVLIHQDELGDRVTGVAAGYLLWSGRFTPALAIAFVEHIVGHQMGAPGRELVAAAGEMGGRPVPAP